MYFSSGELSHDLDEQLEPGLNDIYVEDDRGRPAEGAEIYVNGFLEGETDEYGVSDIYVESEVFDVRVDYEGKSKVSTHYAVSTDLLINGPRDWITEGDTMTFEVLKEREDHEYEPADANLYLDGEYQFTGSSIDVDLSEGTETKELRAEYGDQIRTELIEVLPEPKLQKENINVYERSENYLIGVELDIEGLSSVNPSYILESSEQHVSSDVSDGRIEEYIITDASGFNVKVEDGGRTLEENISINTDDSKPPSNETGAEIDLRSPTDGEKIENYYANLNYHIDSAQDFSEYAIIVNEKVITHDDLEESEIQDTYEFLGENSGKQSWEVKLVSENHFKSNSENFELDSVENYYNLQIDLDEKDFDGHTASFEIETEVDRVSELEVFIEKQGNPISDFHQRPQTNRTYEFEETFFRSGEYEVFAQLILEDNMIVETPKKTFSVSESLDSEECPEDEHDKGLC